MKRSMARPTDTRSMGMSGDAACSIRETVRVFLPRCGEGDSERSGRSDWGRRARSAFGVGERTPTLVNRFASARPFRQGGGPVRALPPEPSPAVSARLRRDGTKPSAAPSRSSALLLKSAMSASVSLGTSSMPAARRTRARTSGAMVRCAAIGRPFDGNKFYRCLKRKRPRIGGAVLSQFVSVRLVYRMSAPVSTLIFPSQDYIFPISTRTRTITRMSPSPPLGP